MGETCRPWILDFVGAIFGAYDRDAGRRLVNEFFLLISKKNGKSTTAAAIMLTALIRNWRNSGEFLILAPTIEIASNSFIPVRDMVRRDEKLDALFHVQEHYRTITHRNNGGTLKVVAADSETVGGKKAIGVLVDELWLFGKKPNAENILREDRKFVPVLYEFPPELVKDGQIPARELWHLTNPNYGASVDPEFLDSKFREAEHAGLESLCGFYAKHLNIEIGLALRSDRWAGADFWQRQGRSGLTLEEILARCEAVTVGIDGGGLQDLLGLAVCGRDAQTGEWLTWFHAWAKEKVLERNKAEARGCVILRPRAT
jgi:phage terminase large subunit-like protein